MGYIIGRDLILAMLKSLVHMHDNLQWQSLRNEVLKQKFYMVLDTILDLLLYVVLNLYSI